MKKIKSTILTVSNYLSNLSRNRRYSKKLNQHSRIKILCEGDSWIHYPFSSKDLYSYLNSNDHFAVYSIAEGGKTLKKIRESRDYFEAIKKINPDVFIISGGGNDLIRNFKLDEYLIIQNNNIEISENGKQYFKELGEEFSDIFSLVHFNFRNLKIFCHGYYYPISKENKSLQCFFDSHILNEKQKQKIIKILIDCFNKELSFRSNKYPNVHYIDIRNSQSDIIWKDSLHLSDYRIIGSEIESHLGFNKKNVING